MGPRHAREHPVSSLGLLVTCRLGSVMFYVSHFMWDTGPREFLTWPSTNTAMWHWPWRERWSVSHCETATSGVLRPLQYLVPYGSVSHGRPPTQQCDIGHGANIGLSLTETLWPLSSWDLYNFSPHMAVSHMAIHQRSSVTLDIARAFVCVSLRD